MGNGILGSQADRFLPIPHYPNTPFSANWWRQRELHPSQTSCEEVSPLRHMCSREENGALGSWVDGITGSIHHSKTPLPHHPILQIGALGGNRTRASALATQCSAIELRAHAQGNDFAFPCVLFYTTKNEHLHRFAL